MPTRSQGNIFEAASRVQLAIVFGHVGINEMRRYWRRFVEDLPRLSRVHDPFRELADNPIEWTTGRWLMFVAGKENHGMTDQQLSESLGRAFTWAQQHSLCSIATNGIAAVDHSGITDHNRESDKQRAQWLINYATQVEQEHKISIELISLNDVFIRAANDA